MMLIWRGFILVLILLVLRVVVLVVVMVVRLLGVEITPTSRQYLCLPSMYFPIDLQMAPFFMAMYAVTCHFINTMTTTSPTMAIRAMQSDDDEILDDDLSVP